MPTRKRRRSPYLLELLALDTHEEDSLNGTVEGMIAARVERRASGQVASISLSESNALFAGRMRSGTCGSVF